MLTHYDMYGLYSLVNNLLNDWVTVRETRDIYIYLS